MYPILIEWQGFVLPAWHFFYMLAALAGLFFIFHLNLKWSIALSPNQVSGLYTCAYVGGYFGARILSIFIDEWNKVTSFFDFLWLLISFGPMTFYGGMLGASLAAILFAYLNKIPIAKITDLGIPCGLLGLSIGRLGCFFNGDDYGIPIPKHMIEDPPWWAVSFPNHYVQVPRVPIQLIESCLVFLLVCVSYYLKNRFSSRISSGLCGLVLVVFYAFLRFQIEYFRGDPRGWVIQDHLSTSQFLSLVLFTALSPMIYLNYSKKKVL